MDGQLVTRFGEHHFKSVNHLGLQSNQVKHTPQDYINELKQIDYMNIEGGE